MNIKNTIKELKKGLTIGVGIALSVGIISISYAAFTTINQVNPGEVLTSTTFNELITNQEGLKTRLDNMDSKQLSTAWVSFNGLNCPGEICVINDQYNVSSVVRDATGRYTINFSTSLDNANYSIVGTNLSTTNLYNGVTSKEKNIAYVKIGGNSGSTGKNYTEFSVQIFGGKN